MDISSYIRTAVFKLLVLSVGGLALPGCDSVIYDGEGDCSVNYRVKFRYDMNLKFADAFAAKSSRSRSICSTATAGWHGSARNGAKPSRRRTTP